MSLIIPKEAIKEIIELYELKNNYEYCLFHTNSGTWIESGQTIGAIGIKDGVCTKDI